jgi:hypothetical protein
MPRVNVHLEIRGAKGLHNLGYHLTKHRVPHHAWREIRSWPVHVTSKP